MQISNTSSILPYTSISPDDSLVSERRNEVISTIKKAFQEQFFPFRFVIQLLRKIAREKDEEKQTTNEDFSLYVSTFLEEINNVLENPDGSDLDNKFAFFLEKVPKKTNRGCYKNLTPLMIACRIGDLNFVEFLLSKDDIDVNAETINGFTALHLAIHRKNSKIVEALLSKGADINKRFMRFPAIPLAVLVGCLDSFILMSEKYPDLILQNRDMLLVLATKFGRTEFIRLFLEKEWDLNQRSRLVSIAALAGHLECLRLLIEKGGNPNEKSNEFTPLYLAASEGHFQCVELLIEKGADLNEKSKGFTALHKAASQGHSQCVELLIDKGADIEEKCFESSPLCIAIQERKVESVQILLDKGADVNKESKGYLPVGIAAAAGKVEILKLLLDKGGDPNGKTNGVTNLWGATFDGQFECVKLLLDRGASLNETSTYDGDPDPLKAKPKHETALFRAAYNGKLECLKLFLERGADKNEKNDDGSTPLWAAISRGHAECVKVLLGGNAKIDIKRRNSY